MFMSIKRILTITAFASLLSIGAAAQSSSTMQSGKEPSSPIRPFVVLQAQSLNDLEQKIGTDNKVEELIGGEGMQLRVAVQHDKSRPTALAEVHDASDDVYYVLDGSATLTLGGKLDAPREDSPGEWKSPKIVGGQTFEIKKGDLIVVPRGTPHQRTGKEFTMILIKIYAKPLPAPKPATQDKATKP
ncbi:MAG TPA: hypothetical protein VF779_09520 [Pyrinomonadaceae bacterium]